MNIRYSFVCLLILLLGPMSCVGAAEQFNISKSIIAHHEHEKKNGDTYILKDDSVFVAKKAFAKTIVTSTLFFNGVVDKKKLVDKMLWILKATNASKQFVEGAKTHLPDMPELQKDSFVMPITGFDMETHEFTLSSTGHNQLNILTYRRFKPKS